MSDAVIAKVREVCQTYLNPNELLLAAQETVEKAGKQSSLETKPGKSCSARLSELRA